MKRYLKTIFGFMERLKEDHVGAFATQAAYFILLSFIPFLMLFTYIGAVYSSDQRPEDGYGYAFADHA